MLARELGGVQGGATSNHGRAPRLHNNGSLEVGHEFAFNLGKHGVGHQHVVVQALAHANLGRSLVRDGADREGQSRESFVHLDEKFAGALHLQVVNLVEFALEDAAAGLILTRLSLAGRDVDVETEHITWGELPLGDLLRGSGPVDDRLVSINDVSLHLVGEDALDGVALELLSDLLNDLSD